MKYNLSHNEVMIQLKEMDWTKEVDEVLEILSYYFNIMVWVKEQSDGGWVLDFSCEFKCSPSEEDLTSNDLSVYEWDSKKESQTHLSLNNLKEHILRYIEEV